jgi:hypothetical protein
MTETLCSGDGGMCPNHAKKAGLCWGHYKRKAPSRQKPASNSGLGRPKLPPGALLEFRPKNGVGRPQLPPGSPLAHRTRNALQALARAGRELADADAEMSNTRFQNVEERFRAALRRYVKKLRKKSNAAPTEEQTK